MMLTFCIWQVSLSSSLIPCCKNSSAIGISTLYVWEIIIDQSFQQLINIGSTKDNSYNHLQAEKILHIFSVPVDLIACPNKFNIDFGLLAMIIHICKRRFPLDIQACFPLWCISRLLGRSRCWEFNFVFGSTSPKDVWMSSCCITLFHKMGIAMNPCQVIFSKPLVDAESRVKNNPSLQALILAMFIWVH